MKVSNETKVGVLGALAITMLILGYNFLKGRELFTNPKVYYALYDNISGLAKNSPVQINGLKVGQVNNLMLLQGSYPKILATLAINEKIKIPQKSIAQIVSSDILGTRSIEIILGKDTLYHQENDTLLSEIELSLMESVNQQVLPVKKKAEDLLASIDSMVTMIKYVFNENARKNIEASFESINKSLISFQSASIKLDSLVSDERTRLERIFVNIESISSNLRLNNEKITNIIDNVSAISDSVAKSELTSTISKASIAFSEAAVTIDKINRGEGSLGLLLKDENLYNNLSTSAADLDKLLKDINDNPNRYVHFSIFGKAKKVKKEEKVKDKDKVE